MAKQLPHGFERRTTHHEMTRERVPQRMPANDAQTGAPACTPQRMLALVLGEHASGLVTEHEPASKMTVSLERIANFAPKLDLV
jgi:hypothetical protein